MNNIYRQYSEKELKQFWVGLMEGGGSFQVNHWKSRNLQFRLIVKLKYTYPNEKMLKEIATVVKGYVRKVKKVRKDLKPEEVKPKEFYYNGGVLAIEKGEVVEYKEVIWVMDDRIKISTTLQIFDEYPPLTSKAKCGIAFMKTCLKDLDVKKYLNTREFKYERQDEISAAALQKEFIYPSYWGPWLAGFTEAEGCFSIRQNGAHSFSISQKNDEAIIKAIRNFFNIEAKALHQNTMWSIESANTETLRSISMFLKKTPLLGEKAVSFKVFLHLKGF